MKQRRPDAAALREALAADPAEPLAADAVRDARRGGRRDVGEFLLDLLPDLAPDARRAALAVAGRPADYVGPRTLLDTIEADDVPAAELTADLARQVRGHSPELAARLAEVWGAVAETDAERQAQIDRLKRKLRSQDNAVSAEPDLAAGRELFKKTCGQCHELFGEGKNVGPGLTGSNRRDLDYLLTNILDPSAVMAKDYRPTTLLTDDGRVVTGLIRSETAAADHSRHRRRRRDGAGRLGAGARRERKIDDARGIADPALDGAGAGLGGLPAERRLVACESRVRRVTFDQPRRATTPGTGVATKRSARRGC